MFTLKKLKSQKEQGDMIWRLHRETALSRKFAFRVKGEASGQEGFFSLPSGFGIPTCLCGGGNKVIKAGAWMKMEGVLEP